MNIIPQGAAVCIAGKGKICCFIARQNDDFYSRAYHEAEAVRVLAAASASSTFIILSAAVAAASFLK